MRVILADHHPQTLLALKTMLQEKEEFEVVGEATNTADLFELVSRNPPELVLIDSELSGEAIEVVIHKLHAYQPRPIVVIIGSKPECRQMMLQAGADAFFSKGDQPDWLMETLQKFTKSTRYQKES